MATEAVRLAAFVQAGSPSFNYASATPGQIGLSKACGRLSYVDLTEWAALFVHNNSSCILHHECIISIIHCGVLPCGLKKSQPFLS